MKKKSKPITIKLSKVEMETNEVIQAQIKKLREDFYKELASRDAKLKAL